MDEQLLFLLFVVAPLKGVNDEAVIRRQDSLSRFDLRNQFRALGMDEREFEFRHLRKLLARFLDPLLAQSWDLNKDAVLAHGADDRFAGAEFVNALPNDFDRLVEHLGRHVFALGALKLDQERGAAFDVETERDLLFRRINHHDAQSDRDNDERQGEDAFPGSEIGGEVPPKKREPNQLDEKHYSRGHASISFA